MNHMTDRLTPYNDNSEDIKSLTVPELPNSQNHYWSRLRHADSHHKQTETTSQQKNECKYDPKKIHSKLVVTAQSIWSASTLSMRTTPKIRRTYYSCTNIKKAFDRVWLAAVWRTLRKNNINEWLAQTIKQLCQSQQCSCHYWIHGCLSQNYWRSQALLSVLPSALVSIYLGWSTPEDLEEHKAISNSRRKLANTRIADCINGLSGNLLKVLTRRLYQLSIETGMEILPYQTKLMTNKKKYTDQQTWVRNSALLQVPWT